MNQTETTGQPAKTAAEALQLAKLSCSYDRIFTGLIVDGLPTEDSFPQWIEKFKVADREVRERMAKEGPSARYMLGGTFGWFFGEKVVELTEALKELQVASKGILSTNYLSIREIYDLVHPLAQSCTGGLCMALTDLSLTESMTGGGKGNYGAKELVELKDRIITSLEHLNTGLKGVLAMGYSVTQCAASVEQNTVLPPDQQRMLKLWEMLEIAIPRLKENDREPLNEILDQLLQSTPGVEDRAQIMGGESDQGFIFQLRNKVGTQLTNQSRALLSETRSALLQCRREFLTIHAFISTYHQMILAPRAYEEAGAAVQYALLSRQRRYATRACRDLPDQSPQEMANLQEAESSVAESEASLDPNRVLSELSERGDITTPKDFEAEKESEAQQQKVHERSGMHITRE